MAKPADSATTGPLTLQEAADRIGLPTTELAELIREAGVAPAGPEGEWRLAAAEVDGLLRERQKHAARNLEELKKLEGLLDEP